jgi:hypothetical protein
VNRNTDSMEMATGKRLQLKTREELPVNCTKVDVAVVLKGRLIIVPSPADDAEDTVVEGNELVVVALTREEV